METLVAVATDPQVAISCGTGPVNAIWLKEAKTRVSSATAVSSDIDNLRLRGVGDDL